MSKFLDRLEKIRNAAPIPMGFGAAARAEKLPGMALVLLVSREHAAGMTAAGELLPDAALLTGLDGPADIRSMRDSFPSTVPWGTWVSSLGKGEARDYLDCGCDLLAFALADTAVGDLTSDEMARILCLDPGVEERELRAVEALPIDILLLPMGSVTRPWTLQDLANIGVVTRWVSKYILVQISQPPDPRELEALRDIGVHGLVLDASSVSSQVLADLKTALLEMPRPKGPKGGRASAILPSSAFAVPQRPPPEQEQWDYAAWFLQPIT